MGNEVEADTLGEEFKGYTFRINGGFDKDGFAMKQGVFFNHRVRLLLAPGASGYRAKRKGERKRRSVRGCIVGPDIKMLALTLIKKGEKDIPGLTDEIKNRRLGPKRASGIRKLYGIEKDTEKSQISSALIKKNAIRRTFKSKKNAEMARHKAPKIQRLVTEARLRRKKIYKEGRVQRNKRSLEASAEYKKLYEEWASKRREAKSNKKGGKEVVPAGTKAPEQAKAVKPIKKVDEKPKQSQPESKTITKVIENSKSIDETGGAQVRAAVQKKIKGMVKK